MTIEKNVLLAPLTTFRLGGAARYFARVRNLDELRAALDFAKEQGIKVFYLGGGSNVLVRDEGFEGLVIKVEFSGVERTKDGYVAAAGESWDDLAARAVEDGLWGLENLSGIPGTVGGACVQNIGAYSAALSQVLEWVEAFDTALGEVVRLSSAQCAFGYRDSLFKRESGRYIVLRAAFVLLAEPRPNLSYRDLAEHFPPAARFHLAAGGIAVIRRAVLDIRAGKFPDLSVEGTAGSFFLNPVLPIEQAQALKAHYPEMPLFAMPETSNSKVPLGWLLDKALNLKGLRAGGARLYEKQALVIAASRDARAGDVLALRDNVQKIVKEKIGIDIGEEVKII